MKRTLLYYPTIKIPDENWVRQAILYWDEVGSIVPHRLFRATRENKAQAELASLGLFRPFEPEEYVVTNKKLAIEYLEVINSGIFGSQVQDLAGAIQRRSFIYESKFMHEVKHHLIRQKLAKQIGDKVYMDWQLALTYMALLAQYMANDDQEAITTPSSIHPRYRDLVLTADTKRKVLPSLSITFNNLLPVPQENVSIKKILKFKSKHQDELTEFRKVLFEIRLKFRDAKDKNEAKEILDNFEKDITREVNGITETFRKERIPFVLGLFENIIKVEAPAVLSAFLPSVFPHINIPIPLVAGGAAVGGAVTIAKYLLDKRNDSRKQLSENSYSYLYHAQNEGIITAP